MVGYGVLGAGIAVALQDLFKNMVGGIVLLVSKNYRVGDRIEVNSRTGDVIDIGILYTSILEIKQWISGDQPTGRIVTFPNSCVLSDAVYNYNKDHSFIWDEITIPLTYGSDWKEAISKILNIVSRETEQNTQRAKAGIDQLGKKYFLHQRAIKPAVFLSPTDNWITIHIRYVSEARERRDLYNKLNHLILEEIQNSKNIKIATKVLKLINQ